MRYLSVVTMSSIELICLSLAHVNGERLAMIRLVRIVWLAVVLDEFTEKRIRAGGVVRRVGQCEDVLVLADRKALDLAKLGILELLSQLF